MNRGRMNGWHMKEERKKRMSSTKWAGPLILILLLCLSIASALATTTVTVIAGIGRVDPNTSSTGNKYDSHWQYWSQGASKYLNGSDESKLRNMPRYGCRVVAQSKLLVEAGLASSNVATFNPDIYFEWTVANNFQNKSPWEHAPIGEAVIQWGKNQGVTITRSEEKYTGVDQVMTHIRAGRYVIMSCTEHQAYIGRAASLNYGSPVVLDSGSWTSCNPGLAVALSGYDRTTFTSIYVYTVQEQKAEASLSTGVQNIVARAYQQVNMEWTPLKDVYGWNDYVFKAGTTYKGVPYGQPYDSDTYLKYPISFETFLRAVADVNSSFYTKRSAGRQPSVYYCNDCSAFVSYCYDLPSRQTTSSIQNYYDMTTISGLSNAQVGDCLNCANSHVVIITKIYTSNGVTRYEICEQTPPKAKKSEYTAAEVQEKYLNKGYIIRRYNGRDNVAAPDVVGLYGFIDVNGRLDGVDKGSLEGFGTFDIAAGTDNLNDVSDYYVSHKAGTSYRITDVKALPGYDYLGIVAGTESGTVSSGKTLDIRFSFATQGSLHVQGNLDGVDDDSVADYGSFDVYVNGVLRAGNCTSFNEKLPNGTSYEIKNIKAVSGKNYDGIASFTGTITSNTESKVTLSYTSGPPTHEWQTGRTVPENLDKGLLDIEYKYTYTQQARTSPGNDWILVSEGPVQYENDGGQYESDNELSTSETRVLVGYYYYHYCNNGANANYYWKDYLPIRHTISMEDAAANFTVEEKGTDGDGSGRKYYYLIHKNGQWAGGIAQCGTNGSKFYYRGGVYQNKKAYRINTYQKASDWTKEYDATATKTVVRWRLKDIITTEYKGLQLNFVVDGQSVVSLDGVAGLDIYINGEQKGNNEITFRTYFPGEFAYQIQLNHVAEDKIYKRIEGGELNGTVNEELKILTLYFETGVRPEENWKSISADLLPYVDEHTEVEYRHTYTQQARTSPGEGWNLIQEGPVQYENDGEQYESDNELSTSATRVLVGYYYFHWCNGGALANYYKKDYLPTRHTISMADAAANFSVQEKGTDGDGSGRKYYYLTHLNGQWAGGVATCCAGGSKVYYRGGVYQNKKAYQINTYQKVGEWTTELDTSATSVEYRIRLKRYSVTFSANGGILNLGDLVKYSGIDLQLPEETPTRELYSFVSWNTEPDGTGRTYAPATIYAENEAITLYAQWEAYAAMNLPEGLTIIEEEAFADIDAVVVRIPASCRTIESRAFLNCSNLRRIYITENTMQIAVDAFDGCANLMICAPTGSVAIKVAKYNDIPYDETDSQ